MGKGGRPKEDLSSLPKEWYKEVLELYREGGSDVEVKAMIWEWRGSFSNNLWDRWMEDKGEFWETIKMGRMLSESWWMKNGRTNLKDHKFNYTGWYMNMKNRFSWADKHENVNDNKNLTEIIVSDKTLKNIEDIIQDD